MSIATAPRDGSLDAGADKICRPESGSGPRQNRRETPKGYIGAPGGKIVIGTPDEEKRRARVKAAQKYLDRELGGRWRGRSEAMEAIAGHHSPMARAKQIVEFELRNRMFGKPVIDVAAPAVAKVHRTRYQRAKLIEQGRDPDAEDRAAPVVAYTWPRGHVDPPPPFADQSDVQDLLARLIDRDAREPLLYDMVRRLARAVGGGGMDRAEFQQRAGTILAVKPCIPDGSAAVNAPPETSCV